MFHTDVFPNTIFLFKFSSLNRKINLVDDQLPFAKAGTLEKQEVCKYAV